MTASLDGAQRTALSNLIQKARSLIEADLASTLEGHFGIHHTDGRIEKAEALSLNASQAAVRIDLLDVVAFLRSEGETERAAVERLVREAAFTHVNRLVALRVAEGLGILPEAIGNGLASQGFRDFAEIAPASADEEWERFRLFVRICADELSADVPALFDPRNPLLELEPSTAAFSELIESFVAADETIWSAPDALGWSYQFFNSADERKEMRESSAPRTSRELAVRNQFFTPSYVVEFLVQNTLGAHLAASYPALADDLPLLVELPEPAAEAINIREVSALDPACGSGHFLLGAYDVLEAAWRHAGIDAEDAAPDIVRSLWGIDIDPRATQIAQAAVILRARRHCRTPLPRPNVICARSLPATPEADDLMAALPGHVGRVVRAIADELVEAPVFGPLLKIEDRLDREARDAFGTGQIEGTLSEGVTEEDAANVKSVVLETLATIADQTTSTASQRLFAAEAYDAVRFVEALSRRYTTCLMNPPFGLSCENSEEYLKAAYPDSWTELYACFVERCIELSEVSTGAITSSTFLTTKRLRSLRDQLIKEGLSALVDLGGGVLHGATVNTAAFIVAQSQQCRYLDLQQSPDRAACLREGLESGLEAHDLGIFGKLPNSPFAFHVSRSVLDLWDRDVTLDPAVAVVRTGGKTFDNFRYVRAWWELGTACRERGWIEYEKGGEYQPFYAPTVLLLNWKRNGEELKTYGASAGRMAQVMQSSKYWGQPGVCFPRMSSIGFSARLMPCEEIFADTSIAVLPRSTSKSLGVLGFLNTTAIAEILSVFGRGRSTENASAKSLPLDPEWIDDAEIERTTSELISCFLRVEMSRETSPVFAADPEQLTMHWIEDVVERVRATQTALDRQVELRLGLTERIDPTIESRVELNASVVEDELAQTPGSRLLSFLVGVAFGRWEVRRGSAVPELPEFAEQAWREGPPRRQHDPKGPMLLLDDPEDDRDLAREVIRLSESLYLEVEQDLVGRALGTASIQKYLRMKFFKQHLQLYSQGARKAPIYWQLQVASKKWGIWLYMPRLSREMLFAVVRETERRQRVADQRIATLQREYDRGGAGRALAAISAELDAEQSLAVELSVFRDEAERIANLGWEPDLDDGAVLNAAPLARLFPAWKEAAKYRKELKQGNYTWSTVSKYAEQL